MTPVGPNGRPLASAENDDDISAVGSVGGEFFTQDRVTVAEGRMADPRSSDEIVATAEAAKLSGWHVGDTIPFGAITVAAIEAGANPNTAALALRFSAKLVGIVVFASQVVDDDVDRFPAFVLMTPALARDDWPRARPTRLTGSSSSTAASTSRPWNERSSSSCHEEASTPSTSPR